MARIYRILYPCFKSVALVCFLFPLFVAFHAALAEENGTAAEQQEILSLYQKLKGLEIDVSKAAKLENFSFKKDIFEWKLESGYLFLTHPIPEFPDAGGGYFIGQGRMIFEPPNDLEKEELIRYTEKERINEPFQEAFLRFNDDTRHIFEPLMQSSESDEGKKAAFNFKNRQELLYDLTFNLEFPVIDDHLSGVRRNQYLFIETDAPVKMQGEKGWPAFYYNPLDREEVSFFIHRKLDRARYDFSDLLTAFSICKFHKKEDYESDIDLDYEDKDLFHLFHYDMDFTVVKHDLFLDARVSAHLRSMTDSLSAVQIPLYAEYDPDRHDKFIKINEITDEKGNKLPFLYKNFTVLVQLPKKANKDEKILVTFDYRGDFIRPDWVVPPGTRIPPGWDFLPGGESTFTLLNTYPWFPQYGYNKRHTFDLTLRVPKPNIAVASGTTLKRWAEKGYNCLQSKEENPVALTSFLFGKYHTFKDDSQKPVIYVHTLFKQQRQAESLLNEARTIILEFEKYFGHFPYDELDIAQMGFFYGFGQAPPGLVQLTGEAFLASNELANIGDDPRLRSEFLSHEIGHEWWGHVVGWRNYHEQWLSESFTEYISGLYMEATRSSKVFAEQLNDWKKNAIASKESGPIYLGFRLAKNKFRPYDFNMALYNKGPYVLHMFRMALIASFGPDQGNEFFFNCLKNFCIEYRNKNVVTRDFQQIVKKTTQLDMDWFFNQWFRESGIPQIRFSYSVNQTEDGKYLLEGKIRQEDKKKLKKMIIPIFIHFPGDKVHELKPKFMTELEMDVKAKLPIEPELVTIDDRGDLLVEITYE